MTGGEKSEESSGGSGACGQAPRGQVALGQQPEVVALQSVSVSTAPDFYLPALRFLLSSPVGSISGVDYRLLTVTPNTLQQSGTVQAAWQVRVFFEGSVAIRSMVVEVSSSS